MITITKGTYQELHEENYGTEFIGINEPNAEIAHDDEVLNDLCKAMRENLGNDVVLHNECCPHNATVNSIYTSGNIKCVRQVRCFCESSLRRDSLMILRNDTECCALVTIRPHGIVNITAFPGYYDEIINFIDVMNRKRMSISVRADDILVYYAIEEILGYKNLQYINGCVIANDITYKRVTKLTDVVILH